MQHRPKPAVAVMVEIMPAASANGKPAATTTPWPAAVFVNHDLLTGNGNAGRDDAPCAVDALGHQRIRRESGAPEITGGNTGAIFPTGSSRVVFSRGLAGLGRRLDGRLRAVQIVNGRIE
jgi:hypothetical protein